MSQPQVCTVDDGLINPAQMPAKSTDLDTTKITGAADDLRAMGTTVDSTADEIKSIWGGLGACYQAPEQAEVYALMDDPATASEKVKTTFASMAGHLDTYADALEKIKPTLADFERRAQEFRDDVIDGVWVNATEAADANLLTYGKAALNGLTGQDQERKKVAWNEDGATRAKNEAFLDELARIYADVSSAAATCATSINGLTSIPDDQKKITALEEKDFKNPEAPMPWGYVGDEDRNCVESVGHGAYQFGKNTVEGLGQLISYNPESGEWGDWEHAGQAWMGTGNVLMSLAVALSPTTQLLNAGLKLTGQGDSALSQWIDERNKMSAGLVTGLVGIDLEADDPFHKWKEDGVATFTESFLNVGTMFIPGAGQAGAAVKVAGLGSRVLKMGGTIADFAVPGGSWLLKGGMHTIPVLKSVIKFGDDISVNLLDDVAKAGPKVPSFNPGSVADDLQPVGARPPSRPVAAIDDLTEGTAPRTPEKQVTNATFGDGSRPAGTDTPTPRTTSPDADPPAVKPETPEPTGSSPRPAADPDPAPAEHAPAEHAPAEHASSDGASSEHASSDPAPAEHAADDRAPAEHAADDRVPAEYAADDRAPAEHAADDHASTEHGEPTPAEKPHEASDGGSSQDAHGGQDAPEQRSRPRLPDDPVGTYRDAAGRLQYETGGFAPDPHTARGVEYAHTTDVHDAPLDPAHQAAHDALVTERTAAADASQAATGRLNRLMEANDLPPDTFKGSKADAITAVSELRASGAVDRATARKLVNAVTASRDAMAALKNASERLGDWSALLVSRMEGQTTLIPPGGAGAGRFDHVALAGGEPPKLVVYEAKGGSSRLGFRTVDGVRVQQGTPAYLKAIAELDPRFGESLTRLKDKADPALAKAIEDGSLQVDYQLVQALSDGRVKVSTFTVDAKLRHLTKIGGQ